MTQLTSFQLDTTTNTVLRYNFNGTVDRISIEEMFSGFDNGLIPKIDYTAVVSLIEAISREEELEPETDPYMAFITTHGFKSN